MAKEIKTRTVNRDIKAIDKAATAAQHIKHSSVRVKEDMERTQQQNENSPVEYAQDRVADGTERFARDVASQVRQQSGRAINHIKEKQRIKREVNQIQTELREGRISEQGERPSFSLSDGEKVYQPKEQMIKNARSQAVRKKTAERSGKNLQEGAG